MMCVCMCPCALVFVLVDKAMKTRMKRQDMINETKLMLQNLRKTVARKTVHQTTVGRKKVARKKVASTPLAMKVKVKIMRGTKTKK